MIEPSQAKDDTTAVNRLPTPIAQGQGKLIAQAAQASGLGSTAIINISQALDQLISSKPEDIQQIAASQLKLLTEYYNSVLKQASRSFISALTFSAVGVLFFLGAIVFMLIYQLQDIAIISVIIGAIIQAISGLNFWLYGRTTAQLAHFHQSLDQTQRFLLAHSMAVGLTDQAKQETITNLVMKIAGINTVPKLG